MKSYCHKALIWRLILGLVNANFLYTRPLTNSVSLEGAVRFSQNSVSFLHFFFLSSVQILLETDISQFDIFACQQ